MNASRGAGVRSGVELLPRAWRLLRGHRALWAVAAVPAVMTAVCVSGAAAIAWSHSAQLLEGIAGGFPQFQAAAWYSWLWVGPATALVWLATHVLFLLAIGAAALSGLLLATLLASPVLDELSRRAERIVAGRAVGDGEASGPSLWLRDALSALGNEARRLGTLVLLWSGVSLLGLAVPFGVLLTPVALAAVAMVFLPLEYAGFALDRRRVPFAQRRAWLAAQRERGLGFGLASFGVGLVPGLNFVMLPVLIVAGTLFVLEFPPSAEAAPARR